MPTGVLGEGTGVLEAKKPSLQERYLTSTEIDFHNDPRWLDFVTSHSDGSIFHHPAWLTALEHEYGGKAIGLVCLNGTGKLCGVLPLMITKGLPFNWGNQVLGKRLASLPRTPVAGPLYNTPEAATVLLNAAIDRARNEGGLQLQIKSMNGTLTSFASELGGVVWKRMYVLELPETIEDLRFVNSTTRHRIKSAVSRATKLGVEVRTGETETDFQAFFELYLETMRWHGSMPRPYRFFATLWEQLRPLGQVRILMAERQRDHQRTLLSAYFFLMCGQTVHCFLNGRHRDELNVHPNDILQWKAIHDACREGFRRYDFGEVGDEQDGLANFKTKWGAKPLRSYRYYYPATKDLAPNVELSGLRDRLITALWRKVPIPVTTRLGDWLYRYL